MNKIILIGRLTKTPELKATSGGINFTKFNIASNSKRKEAGEKVVDFFSCTAWRDKAERICEFCEKGTMLQICGEMTSRSYEKDGGSKQTFWEVVVEDFEFISLGKKEVEKQSNLKEIEDDEDLPF